MRSVRLIKMKIMEIFEQMINFINSYPIWAKYLIFLGVIFTFSILVFAPRNTAIESNEKEKGR